MASAYISSNFCLLSISLVFNVMLFISWCLADNSSLYQVLNRGSSLSPYLVISSYYILITWYLLKVNKLTQDEKFYLIDYWKSFDVWNINYCFTYQIIIIYRLDNIPVDTLQIKFQSCIFSLWLFKMCFSVVFLTFDWTFVSRQLIVLLRTSYRNGFSVTNVRSFSVWIISITL